MANDAQAVQARLRHHVDRGPPVGAPADYRTMKMGQRLHNTVGHLQTLPTKNRFAALEGMCDSKIRSLKKVAPNDTELGRQVRSVDSKRRSERTMKKFLGPRLVISYATRKMANVNVRKAMQSHQNVWPFSRDLLDATKVTFKPLQPKGFRNHTTCSLNANDLPTTCACTERVNGVKSEK